MYIYSKKEIDEEQEENKKVIKGHAEKVKKDFEDTHREVREGFNKGYGKFGKHGGWNKDYNEW